MKKVSKTLAIVLCLAMILSLTALASWTQFGGSSTHNGRITDAAPPITASPAPTIDTANLNPGGSGGWDGVDSVPVMRTATVNSQTVTYAYVLYDSRNDGAHLLKYDCTNLTVKWDKKVGGSTGFQLSTPLLLTDGTTSETNDVIYLGASNALKNSGVDYEGGIIDANDTFTETFNNLELTTASNRVAVGIYLGQTSVQNQGTINTTGTATITLGNKTVNLTLSKTTSGTTTYKMFEEPVYSNGSLVAYNYYYYINHNLTDSVGTGKTLSVSVTLNADAEVEYIELYGATSAVQKVTGLNNNEPTNATIQNASNVDISIPGQINTPITGTGDYIFFGTYSGTTGGVYYQYDTVNKTLKSWDPANSNFYWAGAYTDGTNVVFGSDNGYLFCTAVGANFGASGYSHEYSLNTLGNISDAGNVRSTICYYDSTNDNVDNGDIYFTSQGGSGTSYIWKVDFTHITNLTSSYIWHRQLSGGSSTSTPAISANGYIYVGTYGNNSDYSNNGVRAIPLSNFTSGSIKNIASGTGSGSSGTRFAVQSSVIVYTPANSSTDYVFFTVNDSNGAGYCYSFNGTTGTQIWKTPNATYALQGMAACNGYLVFGNDADTLYIIH